MQFPLFFSDDSFLIGCETGAMIACKLAAMVPNRILSLAVLNVTGGGFECFPKVECLFFFEIVKLVP